MCSFFYPAQWSRSNITLIFIYILKFDIKKASHSKYRISQCSRQTCSKWSQRLLSPPPTPLNSLLWLCDKDQHLLKDKPGPPPIWAFKACWTTLYYSVKGYACHEGASSCHKAVPPIFAPAEDFPVSLSSCRLSLWLYAVQYLMEMVHSSGTHRNQLHHIHGFKHRPTHLDNSELQSLHIQSFQIKIIFHEWEHFILQVHRNK